MFGGNGPSARPHIIRRLRCSGTFGPLHDSHGIEDPGIPGMDKLSRRVWTFSQRREVMADAVVCCWCGNPMTKLGAYGEECRDCMRLVNKKPVPIGIVKCDGLGRKVTGYFRPKGWKGETNGS